MHRITLNKNISLEHFKVCMESFLPKKIYVPKYSQTNALIFDIDYPQDSNVVKYKTVHQNKEFIYDSLDDFWKKYFHGANESAKEIEADEYVELKPGKLNKLFFQLFMETSHGDVEHRQWLYNKYIDFQNNTFEKKIKSLLNNSIEDILN